MFVEDKVDILELPKARRAKCYGNKVGRKWGIFPIYGEHNRVPFAIQRTQDGGYWYVERCSHCRLVTLKAWTKDEPWKPVSEEVMQALSSSINAWYILDEQLVKKGME